MAASSNWKARAGRGSTFSIYLPADPALMPAVPPIAHA